MIDILGTIYTQGTYDEEGNELTPPVPQEGFHVNTIILMPDMIPYQITPTTPRRVFAGAETYCLKFADRAEWLALGYETTNEDGEQAIDDSQLISAYKERRRQSTNAYRKEQAITELKQAKAVWGKKPVSLSYLDTRLEAIENILGIVATDRK